MMGSMTAAYVVTLRQVTKDETVSIAFYGKIEVTIEQGPDNLSRVVQITLDGVDEREEWSE